MMSEDFQKTSTKKPFWLLLPILMGLFQSSLIAATPTFISDTGLSSLQWSILLSMPTLLFLLLSPLWGKWADKLGASYLIRYSAFGLGLSIIGLAIVWWVGMRLAFVPGLWFITIALTRILYGISASGVMPLCQSLAIYNSQATSHSEETDKSDKSLKYLGLVSASLSTGRLVGPLVLIAVLSQVSWLLVLYSLVTIPLVYLIVQHSRKTANRKITSSDRNQTVKIQHKAVLPSLLLAFCTTLFVGYLQFVLGPLLLDWLSDSKQATMTMSLLLTVVATSALLCQLLIVKRLNWQSSYLLPILSIALVITALTLSIIDSVIFLMLMMIPIAFSIALLTPVYTRRAMAQYEHAKGQVSGKLAVCHTAGYPLGSLLAGVYYPAFKLWWLPLAIIASVLACVSFLTALMRSMNTQPLYKNE